MFGEKKDRLPDEMWLTPRCQRTINAMNAGDMTEEQALSDLQAVGNTLEQAQAIIERHRGISRKVPKQKVKDTLRTMKR